MLTVAQKPGHLERAEKLLRLYYSGLELSRLCDERSARTRCNEYARSLFSLCQHFAIADVVANAQALHRRIVFGFEIGEHLLAESRSPIAHLSLTQVNMWLFRRFLCLRCCRLLGGGVP